MVGQVVDIAFTVVGIMIIIVFVFLASVVVVWQCELANRVRRLEDRIQALESEIKADKWWESINDDDYKG
jgi:ABC-type sulfate transport system permease component